MFYITTIVYTTFLHTNKSILKSEGKLFIVAINEWSVILLFLLKIRKVNVI